MMKYNQVACKPPPTFDQEVFLSDAIHLRRACYTCINFFVLRLIRFLTRKVVSVALQALQRRENRLQELLFIHRYTFRAVVVMLMMLLHHIDRHTNLSGVGVYCLEL